MWTNNVALTNNVYNNKIIKSYFFILVDVIHGSADENKASGCLNSRPGGG